MGQAKRRGTYGDRVRQVMGSNACLPDDMRYLEGEGTNTPVAKVAAAQRHVTAGLLHSKTAEALVKAYYNAAACGEHICTAGSLVDLSRDEVECEVGCHFCCTQAVAVTIPEIAAIVDFIDTLENASHQVQLKRRVAATAADVRGRSFRDIFDAKIPCPLLEEGRCAVYQARPLACHGMDSFSRAECESAYDGQSRAFFAPIRHTCLRRTAFPGITVGVRAGLVDAGLPGHTYELIAALDIAFGQQGALARWLSGALIFEEAVHENNAFTEFVD